MVSACAEPAERVNARGLLLGVLQLGAILRFSDTLDWDTPGAWIYLGAVLAVLAVGVTGSLRCRRAFRT